VLIDSLRVHHRKQPGKGSSSKQSHQTVLRQTYWRQLWQWTSTQPWSIQHKRSCHENSIHQQI